MFKQIDSKNINKFKGLEKGAPFKGYLAKHPEIKEDFLQISTEKNQWTYWIYGTSKPFLLLICKPLFHEEGSCYNPFIEEGINTLWIDLVPLDKSHNDKLAPLLQQFIELSDNQSQFLSDPESQEEDKVALWEMAGFKRVGSFIKGKGFFQGTPHYVMKCLR